MVGISDLSRRDASRLRRETLLQRWLKFRVFRTIALTEIVLYAVVSVGLRSAILIWVDPLTVGARFPLLVNVVVNSTISNDQIPL